MSETFENLKDRLEDLKSNPPWSQGGNGDEGSRSPYPWEYAAWIAQIALLEAEIGALQLINRP